ncbi:MAG: PTS sugar transporter subunit IIA [Deferribacteraceae bacterium]|jgi:PTS system mannose-specific IIA component|nr:PTS sugar transporter subunit IIA [Deferribacteraceae bacterium]
MIDIVIITHGLFGEELMLSAEMILGKQGSVHTIAIQPDRSVPEIAIELDKIIESGSKDGVLILTDMFGGSPSNVAFSYAGKAGVEIISGVNLPMLLKSFSGRMTGEGLTQLANSCCEAGKNSIKLASELMKKR